MVKNVSEKDFNEEIKSGVVLVDFYATWCGPCKMLSPIIDEVENNYSDVKFIKINVDENNNLAAEYNILSIPTLLLFKDGNIINKHIGFLSKSEVIEFINKKDII